MAHLTHFLSFEEYNPSMKKLVKKYMAEVPITTNAAVWNEPWTARLMTCP